MRQGNPGPEMRNWLLSRVHHFTCLASVSSSVKWDLQFLAWRVVVRMKRDGEGEIHLSVKQMATEGPACGVHGLPSRGTDQVFLGASSPRAEVWTAAPADTMASRPC